MEVNKALGLSLFSLEMEKVQPPKQFGSSDIETSDEATIWPWGADSSSFFSSHSFRILRIHQVWFRVWIIT